MDLSSGLSVLKKGVQPVLPGFTPSVNKAPSFANKASTSVSIPPAASSSPLGRALEGSMPPKTPSVLTKRAEVSPYTATMDNPVARAQSSYLEKSSPTPNQREFPFLSTAASPGDALRDAAYSMAGIPSKSPVEQQEAEAQLNAKKAMAMNKANKEAQYGGPNPIVTKF